VQDAREQIIEAIGLGEADAAAFRPRYNTMVESPDDRWKLLDAAGIEAMSSYLVMINHVRRKLGEEPFPQYAPPTIDTTPRSLMIVSVCRTLAESGVAYPVLMLWTHLVRDGMKFMVRANLDAYRRDVAAGVKAKNVPQFNVRALWALAQRADVRDPKSLLRDLDVPTTLLRDENGDPMTAAEFRAHIAESVTTTGGFPPIPDDVAAMLTAPARPVRAPFVIETGLDDAE
jgi:hypothetical protein